MKDKILQRLCNLQSMARSKDLEILCGKKGCGLFDTSCIREPIELADDEIGYAVIKNYAGTTYSVDVDGNLRYETYYDGPFENWTIWFRYSLQEAEQVVESYKFDIRDSSLPKFYGFIRIYDGENQHIYYDVQNNLLNEWAKREHIEFEDIFVCIGGRPDYESPNSKNVALQELLYPDAFDNAIYSCEEGFKKMRCNDVLCVTDMDRLDGDYQLWKGCFVVNIIEKRLENRIFPYRIAPADLNVNDDNFPF